MPIQRPGLPDQPEVKIEYAWRVGPCGHHLALDRNAVAIYFLVEWLAENDDVLVIRLRKRGCLVLVKPELQSEDVCDTLRASQKPGVPKCHLVEAKRALLRAKADSRN